MSATGRPSKRDDSTKTSQPASTRVASSRRAEQRHPRTEAELLLERADLGLERTLADQDEPRTRRSLQDARRGVEQRRIVLLRTQVGDRPHDDVVRRDAELNSHRLARRAVPRQRFEVDAMLHDLEA